MARLSSTRCIEIMAELAELLPGLLDKRIAPTRILPDLDREKMPRCTKGTPVFTGGSIVSLLVSDSAAPPISLTKDVDAVLEIVTHWDFEGLGDALRGAGFVENVSAGVMGVRWIWHGVEVDFMPHQAEPGGDKVAAVQGGFASRHFATASCLVLSPQLEACLRHAHGGSHGAQAVRFHFGILATAQLSHDLAL
jgi:hypothetical protein